MGKETQIQNEHNGETGYGEHSPDVPNTLGRFSICEHTSMRTSDGDRGNTILRSPLPCRRPYPYRILRALPAA